MKTQNAQLKAQSGEAGAKPDLKRRAYLFAVAIVRFVRGLPASRGSAPIADQLLRSGTSIGANVIEAQGASSRKDFTRFFEYALKSAHETKYWLCLVRDGLEFRSAELDRLLAEAGELGRILGASTLTLKGKPTR